MLNNLIFKRIFFCIIRDRYNINFLLKNFGFREYNIQFESTVVGNCFLVFSKLLVNFYLL